MADARSVWIPSSDVFEDEVSLTISTGQILGRDHAVATVFLPGYTPSFSRAFREWIDVERERVHGKLRRTIIDALARACQTAAYQDIEQLAQLCLEVDPLNEYATLALAEATAASGRGSQALSILDDFLADSGCQSRSNSRAEVLRRRISAQVRNTDRRPTAEAGFVGRSTLLRMMSSRLGTDHSPGAAFLLAGEAGIGKTRLATELALRGSLRGYHVLRLQAHAGDSNRPLAALVDLVPLLRQLPGSLGTGPDALRCLDRIVRHEAEGPAAADGRESGEYAFARIQDSFVDLVEATHGETRLFLCVDDAHWLDQMSVRLIGRLAALARERGWFLVATVRTGAPVSGNPELLLEDDSFEVVRVPPLDRRECRTLLRSLIGNQREYDAEFELWCLGAGDGNPLFLSELAHHFVQTGERLVVPHSLTQLLERRLGVLSSPALLLLQCISVLGKSCSVRKAEAVLQLPSHAMLSALDELGHAQLLTHTGGALACRHELVGESALGLLSAAGLAHLHRLAGSVLEAEYSRTQAFSALWDAARHWALAGDSDRARDLAQQCGSQLLDIGLAAEAERVFNDALDYCRSPELRAQFFRLLANAQFRAGHWAAMVGTLEQRKALRTSSHEVVHDGTDEARVLEGLWRSGASCDEIAKRVSDACDSLAFSPQERAEIIVLGLKYADNVLDERMVELMRARLTDVSVIGPVPQELLLQADVIYHASYGNLDTAVEAVRELVIRARRDGDPFVLGRTLRWAGDALRRAGLLTEAWNCVREAVAIAEHRALSAEALSSTLSLLALAQHTDSWAEVDVLLPKARRYAALAAPHDPWAEPAVYALYARAVLHRGDVDKIRALSGFRIEQRLTQRLTRARGKLLAIECDVQNAVALGSVSHTKLMELHDLYELLGARGDQDYLVGVLTRLLLASDHRTHARRILHAYIAHKRRERYALPADLRGLQGELAVCS